MIARLKDWSRYHLLVILALALACIWRFATLLTSPMGWGVMDDILWIHTFGSGFDHGALGAFLVKDFHADLGIGRIRPLYPIWSYFVYGIMGTRWGLDPHWVYALCFAIYLGIGAGFSSFFGALSRGFDSIFGRRELKILFFLAFLSFTAGLNLVSLISLQERLAIGFFMLGLLAAWKGAESRGWFLAAFSHVLFVLALLSKPTVVGYFPLLIPLLWTRYGDSKSKWIHAGIAGAIAVAFVAVNGWVASRGWYTTRYFNPLTLKLVLNTFPLGGPWAYVVSALMVANTVVFCAFWRRFRPISSTAWCWPIALWAIWAVMLKWGLFGYYWSIVTPLFAGNLILLFVAASRKLGNLARYLAWATVLCGSAIALGPKLGILIDRSVATSRFVEWVGSPEASWVKHLYMPKPCDEAVGAIAMASKRKFETNLTYDGTGPVFTEAALAATWWECPAFPKVEGYEQVLIKDFGAWKAFRLQPAAR